MSQEQNLNLLLRKNGFDKQKLLTKLNDFKNEYITKLEKQNIFTKPLEKIIYRENQKQLQRLRKETLAKIKYDGDSWKSLYQNLVPYGKKQERILISFIISICTV